MDSGEQVDKEAGRGWGSKLTIENGREGVEKQADNGESVRRGKLAMESRQEELGKQADRGGQAEGAGKQADNGGPGSVGAAYGHQGWANVPQTSMYTRDVPQTSVYTRDVPQTSMYTRDVPQTSMYTRDVPQTSTSLPDHCIERGGSGCCMTDEYVDSTGALAQRPQLL
ncbi:hypothetical protein NDU88_007501 [Pleurodeles waltl]|uniref:Uncharacterized protein n=1 Tax=Pleurodeles waltl TaxID=8319 RepID=A0AAV7SSU8_PLEWA|nr:hypothetical protein NDU88_007501 [Pleurodeles waltl]